MVYSGKLNRRFSNRINKFRDKLYATTSKLDALAQDQGLKLSPLYDFYTQVKRPIETRLLLTYNNVYFSVDDYVNKTLRGK